MPTPAAEVEITPTLVRNLLREQHPDLADLPIAPFSNGWDNAMLRLGDGLLVRLPRRLAAADLVEHEQRWLPVIAGMTRDIVPVPEPLRIGVASADYPWSWSILPFVDGAPAAERRLGIAFARDLAAFVARLHVPAPDDAPRNPVRGVPLATRTEAVEARLTSGRIPRADAIRAAWERALAAPAWAGPPVWIHGDLHPLNLLVDDAGRLAAVVDFGDIAAGDPATDLATAWLTFGADGLEARRTFRALVAPDPATWERARGWAICIATAIVAASDDHAALHRIGTRALEAVLVDSGPTASEDGLSRRPDRD